MAPKTDRNIFWITGILSLAGYVIISYFTSRHQSITLLTLYFFLFAGYLILLKFSDNNRIDQAYGMGFLFRISLLFLIPNLSDDIYRFLWDGNLVAYGFNPFVKSPLQILEDPGLSVPGITPELFNQFGKDTFSSYPPLNQWIFALAVWLSPSSVFGSILIIRLIIILFETGNILLIRHIIHKKNLPPKTGLIYVLNPLVILELTGNLHFEALMIFFLLLSFYYLTGEKWMKGAISLAMAVLSKLFPLMLFPFLWKKLGSRKGFLFVAVSGIIILIAFIPFINLNMIAGFIDSLGLYFRKFEFNASIYYLVRQAGYWLVGYNIIQAAGPFLGIITLLLILVFSFSRYAHNVPVMESFMWIITIYFAFTTTLHPWYITTLIALCLFTPYRFPVVWSLMIFLSYEGYLENSYRENYWLIFIEYLVVYGWMISELIKKNKPYLKY